MFVIFLHYENETKIILIKIPYYFKKICDVFLVRDSMKI